MLVFRFCSYRDDDSVKRRTDSPFNTSRTLVVSAKISKKYSGGVLRGSILMGAATGATLLFKMEKLTELSDRQAQVTVQLSSKLSCPAGKGFRRV